MDSAKIRRYNDALHEITKASDAIRRKHKMIKLNNDAVQQTMDEVFKPLVTPLHELVDTSKQQQRQLSMKQETKMEAPDISMKIKKSDDRDEEGQNMNYMDGADEFDEGDDEDSANIANYNTMGDDTIVASDIPAASTPIKKKNDDSVSQYLKMFDTAKARELDVTYGVRKLMKGLMIGDSQINFDDNLIHVGGKSFEGTQGLLELLFKKSPDPSIVNDEDEKHYIKIVLMTNAHRKYYQADKSLREDEKSGKYLKFIAPHVGSPLRRKSGKGLADHKIARKEGQRMDYVYWNDPNEIIDRLRQLMGSQAAGHTSHSNEIVSIIEELREAGIIY